MGGDGAKADHVEGLMGLIRQLPAVDQEQLLHRLAAHLASEPDPREGRGCQFNPRTGTCTAQPVCPMGTKICQPDVATPAPI